MFQPSQLPAAVATSGLAALMLQSRAQLADHARQLDRRLTALGHDAATGLPNGDSFSAHLDYALQRHADAAQPMAVMSLRVPVLAMVREALGDFVADELARLVAARLGRRLKAEHLFSRLADGEFACMVAAPCEQAELDRVASGLLEGLPSIIKADGHLVVVRLTIGVSVAAACERMAGAAVLLQASNASYHQGS